MKDMTKETKMSKLRSAGLKKSQRRAHSTYYLTTLALIAPFRKMKLSH